MKDETKFYLYLGGLAAAVVGVVFIVLALIGGGRGSGAEERMQAQTTEAESLPVQTETVSAPSTEETLPTEEPTISESERIEAEAEALLSQMSTQQKLCQLMIVDPSAITGVSPTLQAGTVSRQALKRHPVGGFTFSANALRSREQITTMLYGFQTMSQIPLLYCVDEEGGSVERVMGNRELGTTWLENMYDYRSRGTIGAFSNACTIAKDISALGFNVDLAPVADVWSNPENTVIGKRAYSDDFGRAAELIAAAVHGFHEGGVACTLKHFPGHGDTVADSHKELPTVEKSLDQLRQEELLPFVSGIEAGADLVMVGHLLVTAVDPELPASLSPAVVTGLLREELGFEGVVITDSLGMGALKDYSQGEKCVLALQAGCDLLLGVTDIDAALKALNAALDDGSLSPERIDESVLRVLRLKLSMGLVKPEN